MKNNENITKATKTITNNVVRNNYIHLLGIILIILKLFDKIDISWWFVLLPFYLGFLIMGFIFFIFIIIVIIVFIID